jgi:hypothetical protein
LYKCFVKVLSMPVGNCKSGVHFFIKRFFEAKILLLLCQYNEVGSSNAEVTGIFVYLHKTHIWYLLKIIVHVYIYFSLWSVRIIIKALMNNYFNNNDLFLSIWTKLDACLVKVLEKFWAHSSPHCNIYLKL